MMKDFRDLLIDQINKMKKWIDFNKYEWIDLVKLYNELKKN